MAGNSKVEPWGKRGVGDIPGLQEPISIRSMEVMVKNTVNPGELSLKLLKDVAEKTMDIEVAAKLLAIPDLQGVLMRSYFRGHFGDKGIEEIRAKGIRETIERLERLVRPNLVTRLTRSLRDTRLVKFIGRK